VALGLWMGPSKGILLFKKSVIDEHSNTDGMHDL
jgi:hypothetical protein